MACCISCCISDVPNQWEGQNFDPPQLPHFSTDFSETQNQERHPEYDPTFKIWLMWDDGKRVCVGRAFSVTFCVLLIQPMILLYIKLLLTTYQPTFLAPVSLSPSMQPMSRPWAEASLMPWIMLPTCTADGVTSATPQHPIPWYSQ